MGSVRAVEQTPELAQSRRALPLAYPEARIVHIVRDGRDVACSLLEKPWLRPQQARARRRGDRVRVVCALLGGARASEEFEAASDARRAAWAWRRYVTAARAAPAARARSPLRGAGGRSGLDRAETGAHLNASESALAVALGRAHGTSVGRYRDDLTEEQLEDVLAEAGDLLRELEYL